MTERRLRLAAYGVCRRADQVLLARYVSPDADRRHWTLPGGKVEHAEDPCDAVVREVEEETGYRVEVERLLGVDSLDVHTSWGPPVHLHRVGIYYAVRVTGGELRHEVGGSTDRAAWLPSADVPALERAVIVDVGLKLDRSRPATGHVPPVPVTGLLRP